MWFNDEEDFDEGEAVVPAAAADLVPPASAKKQPPAPNPAPNPMPADPKGQQQTVLNNNTANNNSPTQQLQINNSAPTVNETSVSAGIIAGSTDGAPLEKAAATIFKKVFYISYKFAKESRATIHFNCNRIYEMKLCTTKAFNFETFFVYDWQGLVDYEGDSDEEEEDSELSPSPKRQRLS